MRSTLVQFSLCVALALPMSAMAQQAPVEPSPSEATEASETSADVAVTGESADAATAAADTTQSAAPTDAAADAEMATAMESVSTEVAAETGSDLIDAPAAGQGQIVFFRPKKFAGGAIGFKVREGDAELGKLRSGKYFVLAVEPGAHEYRVHSEAEDVLTLEVEAGETYYVQGTITMGFLAGRPNLSPSDAATFNGMASKLKRVE